MNDALTENDKRDILYVAENEPVRLSDLDDNGARLIGLGLLETSGRRVYGVLTLDGCDAVDGIRRAARAA